MYFKNCLVYYILKYFFLLFHIVSWDNGYSQTLKFASFPDKGEMDAFRLMDLGNSYYSPVNNYLLSYLNVNNYALFLAENDRDDCCMTQSTQYNASKFEKKFFMKHAHMFCKEMPEKPAPPLIRAGMTYYIYKGYGKYVRSFKVERGVSKQLDFNLNSVNFHLEPREDIDDVISNGDHFIDVSMVEVIMDQKLSFEFYGLAQGIGRDLEVPLDTTKKVIDEQGLKSKYRRELPYSEAPVHIQKSLDSLIERHKTIERIKYVAAYKAYEKAMEVFIREFKMWKTSKDEVKIKHIARTSSEPYKLDPEVTLISNRDMVIILFRGTDYTKTASSEFLRSNIEWVTNISAFLVSVPGKFRGKVHFGFWSSLALVENEILLFLQTNNPHRKKRVFISGHSLGGAQAILFSYLLSEGSKGYNMRTYVYGAPAFIGNDECADLINRHLKERIQRFEFRHDIVPRLPNSIQYALNGGVVQIFGKCGTRNAFNSVNELACNVPEITSVLQFFRWVVPEDNGDSFCDAVVEFVSNNFTGISMSACDHNPDFYAIAAHNQLTQILKDQLPSLSGCANRSQFRVCCQ